VGHHEQVRALPEQLGHWLDCSGAVQDDLSAGRVIEPLGEVTERKGRALQTDEILDDEAGLRDLLPQCSGRWQ
jgi:hypothetical protein